MVCSIKRQVPFTHLTNSGKGVGGEGKVAHQVEEFSEHVYVYMHLVELAVGVSDQDVCQRVGLYLLLVSDHAQTGHSGGAHHVSTCWGTRLWC